MLWFYVFDAFEGDAFFFNIHFAFVLANWRNDWSGSAVQRSRAMISIAVFEVECMQKTFVNFLVSFALFLETYEIIIRCDLAKMILVARNSFVLLSTISWWKYCEIRSAIWTTIWCILVNFFIIISNLRQTIHCSLFRCSVPWDRLIDLTVENYEKWAFYWLPTLFLICNTIFYGFLHR